MARAKYLEPQMAPEYRSPHVRSDYSRYQQPPAKTVNAHPSNAIYAPGTGKGTGTAAKKIGWRNRDGSMSPVSGLGGPTGPLSQPMPTMTPSAGSMSAARRANVARAVADGTAADKINTFNKNNTDKYMDAGGNIIPTGGSRGFDVPLDGKGGYLDSRPAPPSDTSPTTSSTAGAAESMRAAADITGPSSSARGEWQQGQPGTSKIVSSYGTGSATSRSAPNAPAVASAIGSVNSGSGIMDKLGNGMKAMSDFTKPQAPTFEGKSRESFFADAAQRQGTQNGYARGNFTSPRPSPDSPYTPKPSAVPTERLQQYADADAKFKENDARAAAQKASPPVSPMISGKLPSNPTPPSTFNKPATAAPVGGGFTGKAGEAAAREAVKVGRQEQDAEDLKQMQAKAASQLPNAFSPPSTFRASMPPSTVATSSPAAETTKEAAKRGAEDDAESNDVTTTSEDPEKKKDEEDV